MNTQFVAYQNYGIFPEGNQEVEARSPQQSQQLELFPLPNKRQKPQISSVPGIPPKERNRYRVVFGEQILGDRLTIEQALSLAQKGDECLDRIQHCFSDSKFRLSGLLVSNAISNAKSDQTVSGELLSVLEKTEEEIRRQEQQHIVQIRAQVRDKCLRDGASEGRQDLTPWDICFKGKGR